MRPVTRSPLAAFLAISLFGCVENSDPVSPDLRTARPSRYEGGTGPILTKVSSPDIALLGIQVSGPEFKAPLRYQIPLADGKSATGLSLPIGSGYELDVRGYDRYGEQTFQGEAALEHVELGENRPLSLALNPTGKGERAEAMLTLAGEEHGPEGLRIVIEADRKEVGEGQSAILRAYGIDAKGQKLELDPRRLNWSIGDPRLGRFDLDPLKPNDPNDWMKFNAIRFLEEARRGHDLFVTVGGIVGVLNLILFRNPYVDISAGADVTCAVRMFGDLSCWGSNDKSMLGIGNVQLRDLCVPSANVTVNCALRPTPVLGGRSYSSVSVGMNHVCAIQMITGHAYCWGSNSNGQLGVPMSTTTRSSTPIAVAPPAGFPAPLAFKSISAGGGITCGIITAGFEFCWGGPVFGDVPRQKTAGPSLSTVADGFSCRLNPHGTTRIECDALIPWHHNDVWDVLGQATTAGHVCAVNHAGETWCWGSTGNTHGQLGNGFISNGRTRVHTASPLTAVATGGKHSCGLAGSVAFCWGNNHNGQLGIADKTSHSFAPRQVTNGPMTPGWIRISTGHTHTCAIDTVQDVWCWGNNHSGQLGIGTKIDFDSNVPRQGVFAPVKVVGP